jgi:NAD(P)H-hydrate epimerase
MKSNVTVTREIPLVPARRDDVHKGDVGRLMVIGGCFDEVAMVGAPALVANAAFRSGAGLVRILVPERLLMPVAVLAPCATMRLLPETADGLLQAAGEFSADVAAVGPGLGQSLSASELLTFLEGFRSSVVIDADGLNLLATVPQVSIPHRERTVLTPHPGELRRLLAAHGLTPPSGDVATARREAAVMLAERVGGVVVLKGRGTVVTDGQRMYVNETGNAGMATAGAGDVLTGVIAALIGQKMPPMEAAILGVYLHGLAGDFAAEEMGRWSMTALDIIEYLPEAFCEHESAGAE